MGYVTVVADGELDELLSNEMNVVAEQPIAFSVWVRWKDLVFTGSDPIALGVTEYEFQATGAYTEGASFDLAFPVPADLATDSVNPEFNDFVQLSADYTTPADGSVDQIRMRLKIGANLTAGTVDWSDGEMIPNSHVRDSAVPGIGLTVDDITNRLYGLDQTGWAHADSADALTSQNDTVKGTAVQLAALQASLTPGVFVQELFERAASPTLGASWEENYLSGNGTWSLNGHDAFWDQAAPYGPRESLCRWIGTNTTSTTDYQVARAILGSKATTVGGYVGCNDVIARCDSTKQNYIRFRVFGTGAWSLSKFLAGVETVMASGTTTAPGSGSYILLGCGNKPTTTPRYFICNIGNQLVVNGLTDTTSQFGPSYRGWGFGGKVDGPLFSALSAFPGTVASWIAQDA